MKALALAAVLGSAGLVATGVLPCPCELVSSQFASASCEAGCCDIAPGTPSGLYLEARNATVWGGACHIGSEAVSQGTHAALGWAFEGGAVDGVDLSGVRVAAALQATSNLQGDEVFRTGEVAARRSVVWIDAPSTEARDAALRHVRAVADLGDVAEVVDADVVVARDGETFTLSVPDVLHVEGDAMPDRSCCTMPESRWYAPLADTTDSIVGNPARCRFEGAAELARWAFEGENSAFIATFGA